MRLKKIVLLAASIAAFSVGVWFFVSPSLERQADLDVQGELLEGIMAAIDGHEVSDYEAICNEETELVPAYELSPPQDIEAESEPDEQEGETAAEPEIPLVPLDPANFPNGIVPLGILTIGSIDLILPVMEGVDEPELRIAPGHVTQTPMIGETGNAVIAGHRNFTFGSMFNRLGEVENGDIIEFQAMNGAVTAFEVFEVIVTVPGDQIAFIQPQDEAIITLYTCTPIREATHRLLIRARIFEGGF
jgi:sortase A